MYTNFNDRKTLVTQVLKFDELCIIFNIRKAPKCVYLNQLQVDLMHLRNQKIRQLCRQTGNRWRIWSKINIIQISMYS